jgi:hypothetical protein
MRAAALALLIAVAWAAPAAAQAPSTVKFTPGAQAPFVEGGARIDSYYSFGVKAAGGWDGGAYFATGGGVTVDFDTPQAMVELFVRLPVGADTSLQVCLTTDRCESQALKATGGWQPVVLAGDDASITSVASVGEGGTLDVDDVAFSTVRQPDTTITRGSDATTFLLGATVERPSFRCSVDGGPFAPCASPASFAGLTPGPHTLAAVAVDLYGEADGSPARIDFVVPPTRVVPPPPPPDRDRDGVADAADNCPDAANSDQADGDADGVGNPCDPLAPGNVPPRPGETSVVRVLSGEVFVKLPTRTRLGFDGLRAPLQAGGFQPLKGAAAIPLGATVDTTRGEVAIDSAANSFPASDRRARRQQARLRAALFRLTQKRAKARSAAIPTDVGLLSPPGAEARCAGTPAKGTAVRTLSMVVKGYYRTLGGASTATARSATFNTTDRCDGTLTEVGKGRVTLAVKARKRPVVVRAGQAYLVKAKLFKARRARG